MKAAQIQIWYRSLKLQINLVDRDKTLMKTIKQNNGDRKAKKANKFKKCNKKLTFNRKNKINF